MEYGFLEYGSTEWAREMVVLEAAARLGVGDRDSAHWREMAYVRSIPGTTECTKPVTVKAAEPLTVEPSENLNRRNKWWSRTVWAGGFGTGSRFLMMR